MSTESKKNKDALTGSLLVGGNSPPVNLRYGRPLAAFQLGIGHWELVIGNWSLGIWNQQSTVNSQQSTVNSQQITVNSQQSTDNT
ncbi:hypothetical protein QUB05_15045 [Microcoleus sp. F10-C6]|uniref:hypothetical protein n=1 Tax=unclassified Microcoleus TaxID=2642155 RepID=UPI002FD413BE